MLRSYIVLALITFFVAACPSGKKATTGPGSGANKDGKSEPVPVRATSISWVLEKHDEAEPPETKLLIALTDETGATDHNEVGVFPGTCSGVPASAEVVIAATCGDPEKGVRLHVVHRRDELIVLRAHGHQVADELAFDIIKRIKVPIGAKIIGG